mmetsp:Transcript_20085/g.52234  ORF Transcript_20085/g.52234 Transcript_20085/m.52234 type:complete len:1023 (-) Transcript_20085:29-3097(-)
MPESSQLERDDVAAWTAARDAVIADRHCWDREALQSERARKVYAADAARWKTQQERPPSDQMITAAVVSSKALLGQIVQEELPERLLRKPPVKYIHAIFVAVRSATGLGAGLFDENQHIEEDLRGNERHRHAERAPQTRAEKTKFLVNLVACVSQILDETWIAARCAPNPIIAGEDALGANFLLQNLARAALRGQKASERAVKRVKRIGEQELYGRSIAIRKAVVKSQAKARGDTCRRRRLIIRKRPDSPPAEAPPKRVFVRDTREQDAADTAIGKAMRMRNQLRDAALAAETAHNAQAFLKELETARKLQRECRKKLSALDARKKHLEVQEVLLADKDEQIRKRETRAKRLTDRAQRELKKLEKQKQDWEEMTATVREKNSIDSDGNSTIASVQTFQSRTSTFQRGASVDSRASTKSKTSVSGTGAQYARAARLRAKKRQRKKMNQEIKLQGDLDIARGALTQTPSGEINRAMRALGGARGVFGEFLREQLVEVRDEIARMPEEAMRPRAAPTRDDRGAPAMAFPLPLKAPPSSEYVLPMDGFAPPADLGLASVARLARTPEVPKRRGPRRQSLQDAFAPPRAYVREEHELAMKGLDGVEPPRPDAEERPPAMGLDGFEPPRPDAEERPPAMGLDGFEPPADDDAPSTAAPPESPRRPEHAVHADHVEGDRVLVHHDAGETYGGDDSEDDYAEDDFDDVFDAEDIAADEAAADEPTAEPAEPAQEPATQESAAYWRQRKAHEPGAKPEGDLCKIAARRGHFPLEDTEMSLEAGAAVVVRKSELSDEPGWIFPTRGDDACGYVPRTYLLRDSSPTRNSQEFYKNTEKPAADIWTAEPEVPGYADGAADEARAFLEQARARRGVRDVFRDEEPKKDEAEARAAEAGKLRDAVQQLGDSESAPSTAAAVEGIDDDAAFTQHIADEANASEDENPAWDSSDYSSGDFDYPVDPSTAGNSPARQRLRSGPGLGDGDVASPPARNDDDDWFAAEEPPKKPAPKEVAGYLSKFDADFERAMAKHRRHL